MVRNLHREVISEGPLLRLSNSFLDFERKWQNSEFYISGRECTRGSLLISYRYWEAVRKQRNLRAEDVNGSKNSCPMKYTAPCEPAGKQHFRV